MKHLMMALTLAVLLTMLLTYTLVQSSKQYDSVYHSNNTMISLHKLDYGNAVDDNY